MNSTFKKVALASALLASSAIVAPAFAATLTTTANTAGSENTIGTGQATAQAAYVAPALSISGTAGDAITPALGRGKNVALNIPGLTNAGNIHLIAYYFDSSDSFLEAVTVASDTTANGATTLAPVAALATNTAYKYVRFGIHFVNVGDGVGTANAIVGLKAIQSNGTANADTNMRLVTRAIAKTSADAASAIGAALKADTTISRYELSDYAGPTFTAAKSSFTGSAGTTKPVYLTSSVGLGAITTGTDQVAQVLGVKASDSTNLTTNVVNFSTTNGTAADTVAGDRGMWISKAPGTADAPWDAAINAVKVIASTGNVADLAGNTLAFPQSVTITAFDQPKFATTGTAKALVTAGPTLGDLFESAGATIANGATVTVSLRLNEALNDATSNLQSADFTLANGNGFTITAVATGTADDEYVALTLTNGSGAARTLKVDANGKLTIGTSASDTAATTPTVTLAVDNATGKLTTKTGGTAIADVPTAENIYIGMTPTTTVKTYDANADGTLDGIQIVADAPFSSTIAASHGISIQKSSDTTVTSALGALSLDPTSAKTLRVPGTQATIVGFVVAPQTQAANLNTGVVNTDLPFKAAVASSAQEYASVYKATTGAKVTLADIASTSTIADGASPVILSAAYLPEEGTSPAAGQLQVVTSEALANITALDSSQILLAGSSLQLLNLNDGVKALGATDASKTKTTVTDDTAKIGILGTGAVGKVTASVAGKVLTMGSSASGLADAAGNKLATDGTKTVTTGATVYAGPQIAQAIATRSTNAVDGNIDQIVLKFDKGVTLATGGSVVDGMFKVKATVDSTAYTVSIPKANIDLTAAATGYVTLTVPAPGIVGSTKLTALVVEYDANGVSNVGTSSANRLVSTDAVASEITDTDSVFGANDADSRAVTYSKNSTKLYTMEVTGALTTDGSAAAAKGTIVRADLVDLGTTLTYKSGVMTVPCSCSAGNTSIAVTGAGDIVTKLNDAIKLGKGSINAYANVTLDNNTGSAIAVSLSSTVGSGTSASTTTTAITAINGGSITGTNNTGGPIANGATGTVSGNATVSGGTVTGGTTTTTAATTVKAYPVTISATGQVTGTAGAVGTLVLEKAPALKVLDTVYQVTNTGAFRFAVGSDVAPEDAFVLVSAKQPADKFFTGLTSPVQSFANYLPFASNVTASGVIGGNLGTINLAKIAKASVTEVTGWQLVGFQGAIARNSNAVLKGKGTDINRLMITTRPTNGEPATAWAFDTAANANDEGFLLLNNVTSSALQIGSASIDGIKDIDGGFALALKNPSGGFTTDSTVDGEITSGDANTGIVTTEPFSVFYPITGDSNAFGATAGKWSLLTVEQAVASASLATWADTNKVAAIIVVGSGNAQKSWFKGSTTNTLAALAKGDRAFIYFEGANTAFKFGR